DIRDDEVWFAGGNLGDRFLGALRTSTANQSRLAIDQSGHPVAHHRMIIHEENALIRGPARSLRCCRLARRGSWLGRFRFHEFFGIEQTMRTPWRGLESMLMPPPIR